MGNQISGDVRDQVAVEQDIQQHTINVHDELQAATSDTLPQLPNFLGTTVDLLLDNDKHILVNIFDQTSINNQTIFIGQKQYSYPDWMMCTPVDDCGITTTVRISSTLVEWLTTQQNTYKVSGSFWKFSGAYTSSYQDVKSYTMAFNSSSVDTDVKCVMYSCVSMTPTINPSFVEYIKRNIPLEFNQTTAGVFVDFYSRYGTHVFSQCSAGGTLHQSIYTTNSYINQYSSDTTKSQAEVTFFFSATDDSSYKQQITQQFNSSSSIMILEAQGGILPVPSSSAPETWAEQIQNMSVQLDCAEWQADELPEVLANNALDLKGYIPAMRAGLQAYFDRPGCTNPNALNYNQSALVNDGSCEMYVPNCHNIVIGGGSSPAPNSVQICQWNSHSGQYVWLVPGADSTGNCVVAYACADGTGGATSGNPGTVLTQPQILNVMRSDDWCDKHGKEHIITGSAVGAECTASGLQYQWSCTAGANVPRDTPAIVSISFSTPGNGCNFGNLAWLSQPYHV